MTDLAQPSDVTAIAGDGFDSATVASAISWASSIVRDYTKQQFDLVENDVEIVTPHGYSATLAQIPVVAVSMVEAKSIDPVTGAASYATITAWDWAPNGIVYCTKRSVMGGWPQYMLPGGLRVTYTHGFATVPEDITSVCARLAFQFMTNPTFRVEHKVGGKADRWATNGGNEMTPYDLAILDQYRVANLV
ncbi:hypothetical protein [Gordonia sp. N1V]|uniref:hypothetical protein n=1 Tax=Gordonia sp. N1V TaxID=3034163 RepID=UPI0023E188EB|nr:hypothetical protein [Gordonia sp. N1V]MDF3280919.1 hypothetical protein [Gordonia sp. N1V]